MHRTNGMCMPPKNTRIKYYVLIHFNKSVHFNKSFFFCSPFAEALIFNLQVNM